jgi:hypothetical protein
MATVKHDFNLCDGHGREWHAFDGDEPIGMILLMSETTYRCTSKRKGHSGLVP